MPRRCTIELRFLAFARRSARVAMPPERRVSLTVDTFSPTLLCAPLCVFIGKDGPFYTSAQRPHSGVVIWIPNGTSSYWCSRNTQRFGVAFFKKAKMTNELKLWDGEADKTSTKACLRCGNRGLLDQGWIVWCVGCGREPIYDEQAWQREKQATKESTARLSVEDRAASEALDNVVASAKNGAARHPEKRARKVR
jgi:hypothetical protein